MCFSRTANTFTWALLLILCVTKSYAQSEARDTPVWDAGRKVQRIAHGSDIGQEVDPYTGDLRLVSKDVYVPGNRGMDIEVYRVYDTGQLRYRPSGTPGSGMSAHAYSYKWVGLGLGWALNVGPKITITPSPVNDPDIEAYYLWKPVQPDEEWVCGGNNYKFSRRISIEFVDGRQERLVLAMEGTTRVLLSASNWKVTCSGGAYQLHAPNGTKYTMGVRAAESPEIADVSYGATFRPDTVLHASRQTDPYGNSLEFTYAQFNVDIADWRGKIEWRYENYRPRSDWTVLLPTKILANDGRLVEFSYDPGSSAYPPRLKQVSRNGVVIARYVQNYIGLLGENALRNWNNPYAGGYDHLAQVIRADGTDWRYAYWPNGTGTDPRRLRLKSFTLPTGGSVEYDYSSSGYRECAYKQDFYFNQIARVARSDGAIWTYTYQRSNVGKQLDVTTVTGPVKTEIYKHYGAGYFISTAWGAINMLANNPGGACPNVSEPWRVGLLAEQSTGGVEVVTLNWSYRNIPGTPIPVQKGLSTPWNCVESKVRVGCTQPAPAWGLPLLLSAVTRRDGANYSTSYSSHDTYGNPGTIAESGPNGEARTTALTYFNEPAKWIVGRLKSESSSAGSTSNTFDSQGNPLSTTQNGVTTTYTYDSQGNLATLTSPRGYVTRFTNYKRGIPQSETHPESVNIARTVDDAGHVTSETNGEGYITRYAYDGLGRVTSVDYPRGNDSTTTYTSTSMTVTRGPLVEVTSLDGFGRATQLVRGGVTTKYSYDGLGRKSFQSNPGSTIGTSYQYDALDRVTRVTNADNTFKAYTFAPAKVTEVDERNKSTAYNYRGYGSPERSVLMRIDAPEISASVTIGRGADDLVTSVSQGGVTRTYGYDSRKYLTSETNPETGTTSYGRDNVGNMTTRTRAGLTSSFTYDGHNRLVGVTYPSGTPWVTQRYTKTHKLRSVESTAAYRVLDYDENDNLVLESLTIGAMQLNAQYGYSGNDELSSVKYPVSGRLVNYSPDSLGRPTQVSGYVNAVSYWPSGMVKEIRYANGVVTTYDQNNRLWPSAFRTQRNSVYLINSAYTYDGVGNITSVSDTIDTGINRTLGYDGLSRLTTASGPWGAGSLGYDGAGNIRSQNYGPLALSYTYDAQNRLSSVSGGQTYAYVYDANGNVTAGSGSTFAYDNAPNLRCADCSGPNRIDYSYDGLNKRISVTKAGATTYEFFASSGDLLAEFNPSQSNKLTEYINLGGKRVAQRVTDNLSPTSLTIPLNTIAANRVHGVTLTVKVGGSAPSGTVTFMENGSVIGTAFVVNGQASLEVLDMTLGNHTIAAVYSGDAGNSGNTVVMQITVVNLDWLPAVLRLTQLN